MQVDTILVPAHGIAFRKVENQVVIVHPKDRLILTLNEVGSDVWLRLDGRSLKAIVKELTDAYDVDEATMTLDVEDFVTTLVSRGLLVEAGEADER